MATRTFGEIYEHMEDSENISNSKWIRDEMKKQEYYTESKIEQNESKTGPKYFSDYEKLFTVIHKKCNRNWTEPIPVSGYMGEIVYIKPPKKRNSGPITFGHEIPSKPIGKEMTEEELDKLIENSIIASRVTHNYSLGFLGGMVTALFTSFAIRDIPPWEWSIKLIDIYENGIIDKYMKSTNIYDKYNKDKNIFFDGWYQYNEEKLPAFRNKSIEFYKFKNKIDSLVDYHYYEINGQKGHNYYQGTSGLNALIFAYDSILASITGPSYPLDLSRPHKLKISIDSLIYFSTLHCGDNDTTAAIAGAWFGAMYGFHQFDQSKLSQLEFDSQLNKCSKDIISHLKL